MSNNGTKPPHDSAAVKFMEKIRALTAEDRAPTSDALSLPIGLAPVVIAKPVKVIDISQVPPVNHEKHPTDNYKSYNQNKTERVTMSSIFKLSNLIMVAMLISILSLVWMNIRRSSSEGMKLQIVEQYTDQLKEQRLTAEAHAKNAKYRSENGITPTEEVSRPSGVEKLPAANVKTFACETTELTGKVFANSEVVSLVADKTYKIPSGCTNVLPKAYVSSLSGADYFLYVVDSSVSGNYFKCGTYGGRNDSLRTCMNFLNLHREEKVHVSILNDGYLLIN